MLRNSALEISAIIVVLVTVPGCAKTPAPVEVITTTPETAITAPREIGPSWRPGYVRPEVIDVHAHLSANALPAIQQVMADNGLGRFVNLSGGSLRRGAKQSVELQKADPRISHFFNPDWRLRGHPEFGELMAKSLEFAVTKLGFRG